MLEPIKCDLYQKVLATRSLPNYGGVVLMFKGNESITLPNKKIRFVLGNQVVVEEI